MIQLLMFGTPGRLRRFQAPEDSVVEEASVEVGGEGEKPYHPPEISMLFSVSARLQPLFIDANKRWVTRCASV